MTSNDITTKRLVPSPLICLICGDTARGMNFDVMTCVSCKAFFRRNALRPVGTLRCMIKYCCEITKETRTKCPACRLKKCFAFGMKSELIRSAVQYQSTANERRQSIMRKEQQQIQLPTPRPLSLLQNDRSTLTSEQWNLLSNLIHAYDNLNIINHVKCLVAEVSSLPVKLRSKPSIIIDFANYCATSSQTIVKQSSHFQNLSIDMRRILIENNMYLTTSLNSIFLTRETGIASSSDFMVSADSFTGTSVFSTYVTAMESLDPDSTILKIMLFIIAFSSNTSIVIWNDLSSTKYISNSNDFTKVQDVFVNLLWKYLIYRYGFNEAVCRYSSIIKNILDLLNVVEILADTKNYDQMIDMVVGQTDRLLITDD